MIPMLLVALVAALHVLISVVEMLFWRQPRVHGRLDFDDATALKVAPIVANAGLYNAFLAAGLVWSLWLGDAGVPATRFFLVCVMVAGLFGAATLKWTTLLLQTVPAAIAFVAVQGSR